MKRIEYPANRKVPSWSWMAYDGKISYMDIPFGTVEWSDNVHYSSTINQHDRSDYLWKNDNNMVRIALRAPAREFLSDGTGEGHLVFDEWDGLDLQALKCIVIGEQELAVPVDEQKCYILVVRPRCSEEVGRIYERVGVGSIQRKYIIGQSFEVQIF